MKAENSISSKEAENYVLGGMIDNSEDLEIGCENLSSNDFYFEENRVIFTAIKQQREKQENINIFVVDAYLSNLEKDTNLNGINCREHLNYIHVISHGIDIKTYIKVIKEFSTKRKLIDSQKEIFNDIQKGASLFDILEKHKKTFDAIEQGLAHEDKFQIKCIADLGVNWFEEEPPPKKMLFDYKDEEGRRQGFIPKGNVCMVVGMGGIGKSHWVAQLAASAAILNPFLDVFYPTEFCTGGIFLGLAENDRDDIWRLLDKTYKKISKTVEVKNKDDEILKYSLKKRLYPFSFQGHQCQFIREGIPTPYFYDLKRHLINSSPKDGWSLIILDPISRFLGAEAETDNAAATAFIALMEQLVQDLPGNPTILFCHHMNKSGVKGDSDGQHAARGSSAITDGVRLQINLRRPKDEKEENELKNKGLNPDEVIIMTMTKSNFTYILKDVYLRKESDGTLSSPRQRKIKMK